jgi:hypothetical protein
MTTWERVGIVSAASVGAIASAVFVGFKLEPDPSPWGSEVRAIFYLMTMTVGVVWALHPAFARLRAWSAPLYVLFVAAVVVACAVASLYLLVGLWFAFGGRF